MKKIFLEGRTKQELRDMCNKLSETENISVKYQKMVKGDLLKLLSPFPYKKLVAAHQK